MHCKTISLDIFLGSKFEHLGGGSQRLIQASIFLMNFYLKSFREIVRMEGFTRSPVAGVFKENLQGLSIIRAFEKEEYVWEKFLNVLDDNKNLKIIMYGLMGWMQQRLAFLSFLVTVTSIAWCLIGGTNNSAITDYDLNETIYFFSFFESKLISFERCINYTKIPPEQGLYVFSIKDVEEIWPSKGFLIFNNIYVKYRPELDYVLKGLSFEIKAGEKVGIVGRTGAGKSTITNVILRVLEPEIGNIIIDGIDILQMNLKNLRNKITLISQESYLFEGTLQENLDPLKEHTQQELLEILERTNFDEEFKKKPDFLNFFVAENGSNLSVGEKQFICIVRAILKKRKIVLIDEATANIDLKTEELIQKAINNEFKDCTVLTIAHRLNTVINCDKILVVNKGQLEEFDDPKILLKNRNSLFYKLWEKTNKVIK